MGTESIPAVVLGASGYVGAETLRLLASHPVFKLETAVSHSSAGKRIDEVYPHLAGPLGSVRLASDWNPRPGQAVFCALPHGEATAALSEAARLDLHVVDMSADHRLGVDEQFHFGLPDLDDSASTPHVSHPGCFATAITLALAPLVEMGWLDGPAFVSGITGSTGSGSKPAVGTHHPSRNGAVWAYNPLTHRHGREIEAMLGRLSDQPVEVVFVPHSGPFSRGIHVTAFATLKSRPELADVVAAYERRYAESPFISASNRMPSLREVVGTNRCHIGIAVDGSKVAVTSVIDNLVKGAAGGAMQWMNRLFGLDPATGLLGPGVGWA